jgi:hypothetical protein
MSVRLHERVDFIRGELESAQVQLGKGLNGIERKPDSQLFVGEQPMDN